MGTKRIPQSSRTFNRIRCRGLVWWAHYAVDGGESTPQEEWDYPLARRLPKRAFFIFAGLFVARYFTFPRNAGTRAKLFLFGRVKAR